MITRHLLSFLIFTPLFAALLLLFMPSTSMKSFRWFALGAALVQMTLLIGIFGCYTPGTTGIQLLERVDWITLHLGSFGTLHAEYLVGVDGLSLPLVALSVFVLLIATISSWHVRTHTKGYFTLLLILNTSIIGSFCALDLLFFYLFFEFTLLPMYFLIGIWGGQRREYASIKFFLYTLLGSVLILLVIIGLYLSSSIDLGGDKIHTFSLLQLFETQSLEQGSVLHPQTGWMLGGYSARSWAFLLLLIGFGIKLPVIPLHTWLPDAHVEASTPISVILAALLLKIGGYGLARMAYPLFPEAAIHFAWLVGMLGMVSIIYGAMNALASKDLKRLIAYSSVSHMGFVLLGLASLSTEGVSGAIFQMVSHGIVSAMLFLIAGVLYDRTNDRTIANFSGLGSKMPVYTTFVLIAFFTTLGLPGFSGFIGELMVLLGAFRSNLIPAWITIVATSGLILGAAYCLWTIQRMFFGPFGTQVTGVKLFDLDSREKLMFIPLSILVFVLGILPQLLIRYINPFAQQLVGQIFRSTGSQ